MINKDNIEESFPDAQQLIIGNYVLDLMSSSIISRENSANTVKLEPLPFSFLCFLIKHRGEIVTREQLLESVWENRVVSDDSIRKVVKKLRDAFADDAKAPQYIKTLPLKGYSLVATVTNTAAIQSTSNKARNIAAVALTLLIICVSYFLIWDTATPANKVSNEHSAAPVIERLTNMSGSEVAGNYSETLNRLIYLFRNNNNEPWQLYTKSLSSGLVQRLTHDQVNYQGALFSPDGKQVAFARTDHNDIYSYIANFDAQLGLTNIRKLDNLGLESRVLSWSNDGHYLYIGSEHENGESLALFKFNLAEQKAQQLTFPNFEGYGDYYAQESPDGKYLALFRNISDRKYVMVVLELTSMKITKQLPLHFFPNAIVWQPDSQQFAISSFKGDFYYYSLADETLTEQAGSRPGINDVFYTCGARCYFMREHEMNYNEIVEIPNPFINDAIKPTLHKSSSNAEFNPVYNGAGNTIYYTSKNEYSAKLTQQRVGEPAKVLYEFNPRHIVTQISTNPQETLLVGKIEDRIFLLDLAKSGPDDNLRYLTSALETVANPTWNQPGDAIYFSRIEQHQPVLLKYDLLTDSLSKVATDIELRRELADGRIFMVNNNSELIQFFDDGSQKFIIKLPYTHTHNWQVLEQDLYYSKIDNNNVYLNKMNLNSGKHDIALISENSWNGRFQLHPEGKQLIATQSILASSNLIKIIWNE